MNVTDLLRAQSIPLDTLVQLRISRLSKIPRAPDEFARDPRRSFRRENRTYTERRGSFKFGGADSLLLKANVTILSSTI